MDTDTSGADFAKAGINVITMATDPSGADAAEVEVNVKTKNTRAKYFWCRLCQSRREHTWSVTFVRVIPQPAYFWCHYMTLP